MAFNNDSSPDDNDGADRVEDLDERSFEALEDKVEQLAARDQKAPLQHAVRPLPHDSPTRTEAEFEAAVRSAIDVLPDGIQKKLEDVVITVSDDGYNEHAYGMYVPGSGPDDGYRWWFFGMGRRAEPNQIIIYRDTLLHDYGRDPALLRAKITETVRHEVGHALGFDEASVRRLGL
jgi:predicted Zn-dependent protease with MMP-like domain